MNPSSYRLGLTGSIGMGKSTTARMFRDLGVPVWDADATVHALYAAGAAGVPVIGDLAPQVVREGGVDREALRVAVLHDPGLLGRIEAGIHPLVQADRVRFREAHRLARLVVFDIPLLFETGALTGLDGVLVVTAAPEVQRDRVLARSGMTEDMFSRILARQTPDEEKRRRADFVIRTDAGEAPVRQQVAELVETLGRTRDGA